MQCLYCKKITCKIIIITVNNFSLLKVYIYIHLKWCEIKLFLSSKAINVYEYKNANITKNICDILCYTWYYVQYMYVYIETINYTILL